MPTPAGSPLPDVELYHDVEKVLGLALAARLLPFLDRADSTLPADLEDVLPFVQVVRYGGHDDGVTDRAGVDVDWFALTRSAAIDLARRGHQYLTSGPIAYGGYLIDQVTTVVGVVERPREQRSRQQMGGSATSDVQRFGGSYTVNARRVRA